MKITEVTWHSNMDKASKKAHADAAEKRKKLGPVTSDTLADINAKLGNTNSTKQKAKTVKESTIGNFADRLAKKLNQDIGLTYDHPRWGEIPADTFETVAQLGRGSRNQKSRGTIIRWGAQNAAHQTGKDRAAIRKQARKLINDFLATGEKINVKSRVFGDPEAAYRFGKIVVLDEGDFLLIFTTSKLKNTSNYQTQ